MIRSVAVTPWNDTSSTRELIERKPDPAAIVSTRKVDEVGLTIVKFANGVLANCSTSYAYAGANRYRAMCEKGWLDFEPAISYRGLNLRVSPPGKGPETVKNPGTNQFAAEMDHFSQCVMNDKTPDTPGEEGLWDMRVIEAIYRSAREGKTVKL